MRPSCLAASLALLLGSLASAQTISTKGWESAYSRRDYKLGISLSQFKKIPYPDQNEWPGSYSVCSNEPAATQLDYDEVRVSDSLRNAGVIKCMFFWRWSGGGRIDTAGLMLMDMQILGPELFFMSPSPSAEPVLFMIVSEGPAGQFGRVVSAFTTAYVAPKKSGTAEKHNSYGQPISSQTVTWANTVSEIEVEQYGVDVRRFRITHTLTPVMRIYSSRVNFIDPKKL